MEFDPYSLTQDELHRLRSAAESSWSDETRHANLQGHPEPSVGQCRVTSEWLTKRLGGHLGTKAGHFFWVSPDKHYAVDLVGDSHHQPPQDLRYRGIRLDPEDEGWEPTPQQASWQPGPILYKRTTHPLFKGLRIIPNANDERAKLFQSRADKAYEDA